MDDDEDEPVDGPEPEPLALPDALPIALVDESLPVSKSASPSHLSLTSDCLPTMIAHSEQGQPACFVTSWQHSTDSWVIRMESAASPLTCVQQNLLLKLWLPNALFSVNDPHCVPASPYHPAVQSPSKAYFLCTVMNLG